MVVGFNHNVRYKEQLFHVQTEDSGLKNPHIITLLYFGGTIIASQKTSYADITKVDNLETVVEDLMKEQHKEMLRRLKNGEFDQNIRALLSGKPLPADPDGPAPSQPPQQEKDPGKPATDGTGKASADEKAPAPASESSLDEIILSYLVGDEKKK
ncbi:MAG: hypothetical protein GWN87_27370 [Desulfuromonadales bacterium]|nr:hypothetical protein [Desulfuromonadales bacterium]NIS43442.1 hypothetical protein [Desulfuromonadales bacterium]